MLADVKIIEGGQTIRTEKMKLKAVKKELEEAPSSKHQKTNKSQT